jgi:hypothetical protein
MDLAVSSRVACAVASFGRDVINLRAKITRPAEQTRLKRLMRGGLQERVAVMIARNGQYRRGIMIIGRVKLRIIFARELTNLFLCLHHPVFSADTYHSGSPVMKELLDAAVQESGAHPDIVFTAHVHNYQRFTRTMDNQQFTYIVAGAGGYWRLHPMAEFMGAKVTPPFRQEDDPEVVLEIRMVSCGSKLRTCGSKTSRTSGNAAEGRRSLSSQIQAKQTRSLNDEALAAPGTPGFAGAARDLGIHRLSLRERHGVDDREEGAQGKYHMERPSPVSQWLSCCPRRRPSSPGRTCNTKSR